MKTHKGNFSKPMHKWYAKMSNQHFCAAMSHQYKACVCMLKEDKFEAEHELKCVDYYLGLAATNERVAVARLAAFKKSCIPPNPDLRRLP